MISRLRTIIVNEERQLMTLGFALLVFMMTLFAQRLQAQYAKPGVLHVIGDRNTTHTPRQKALMSHHNPTIALGKRAIAVGGRTIAVGDRTIAFAGSPLAPH